MARAVVLTPLSVGVDGIPQPADLVAVGDIVVSIIVAISYLSVTLFVGAMLVSTAGERIQTVGDEVRQHPVTSVGFGLGAVIAGVGGYLLAGVMAAGLAERGAPPQVGILVLVPLVGGVIGLVVATALGQLLVGIVLLDRVSDDGRPNLWAALIVGTVVLGVAAIFPAGDLVGVGVTVVVIGGVTRRVWRTNSDRLPDLRDTLLE
jgi:hypothetical protein